MMRGCGPGGATGTATAGWLATSRGVRGAVAPPDRSAGARCERFGEECIAWYTAASGSTNTRASCTGARTGSTSCFLIAMLTRLDLAA